MPSDVIEAHVRRLPTLDRASWAPRPVRRNELERALLAGLVAGWATHPLDNVRGNAQLLLDRDPDKEFGLTGLQDGISLDGVLDLVEAAAGAPIDREARTGPVEIRPGPSMTPQTCIWAGDIGCGIGRGLPAPGGGATGQSVAVDGFRFGPSLSWPVRTSANIGSSRVSVWVASVNRSASSVCSFGKSIDGAAPGALPLPSTSKRSSKSHFGPPTIWLSCS